MLKLYPMPKHNSPSLDYIRKLYAPQDALLQSMVNATNEAGWPMQVDPEEGKLLAVLVALHKPRLVLEIGTLAGYSALWMARSLPEGGHLYTINKSPEHIALARQFLPTCDVADRITLIEGDAHAQLPLLSSRGPFDMVFIDADKISYPHYLDWVDTNLRIGGLLVADNTLLHGSVWQETPPENVAPTTWKNMRIFNERLAEATRYHSLLLPTQEGLTIALKLT